MDRFIVKELPDYQYLTLNLKSSMDRFIGTMSWEDLGKASVFKIQYG